MSQEGIYNAPQSDLTNDNEEGFGRVSFLSPSSRIGRIRMIAHNMLLVIAWYLFFAILVAVMGVEQAFGSGSGMALMGLSYIPLVVVYWIILIQRLHDLDHSGWWSLLNLIPLVNMVFGLYITFASGSAGRNRWGLKPPPNKWYHWVGALVLPFIFVVGILAAVALPAYQGYVERAKAYSYETQ
jgi:uncharacterized membrane protein YhaH (DUF805 family)